MGKWGMGNFERELGKIMRNSTIEEYLKKQPHVSRQQGGLKVNQNFQKISQPNKPLISIITVTYNAGGFLEQTIQSVLKQTYANFEYIIIDGGSTDNTLDIIKQYENNIDFWCSEPDEGIYDAMNKGIALSSGELVGLINAGDSYLPDALISLVEKYFPSNDLSVYYGDIYRYYPDADIQIKVDASLEDLKYSMTISHQAMFVTKHTYIKHGLYPVNYKLSADYAYALSLLLAKADFKYLSATIAAFQTGGVSDTKLIQSRIESIRIHFNLNSGSKYYATARYIKEIFRYYFYKLFLVSLLGEKKAALWRRERLAKKFAYQQIIKD